MSIERLKETHAAALENILDMVDALNAIDDDAREKAERAIQEDPLAISVRSGWHAPGGETNGAEEYQILLTTGGPAIRIVGEVGELGEPTSASLEVQDWFEPWTSFPVSEEENDALLTYASQFWFGE
jgi:hypothetical protein